MMRNRIRHILKEEKIKHAVLQLIKDDGVQSTTEMVGGIDSLFNVLNINSPMGFLHLFDYMEQVQSDEELDWTLFRDKPKQNLMIYDRKNDNVYISYEIWKVLEERFGLNYDETQSLTERWLGEVYNLRGITTHFEGKWLFIVE